MPIDIKTTYTALTFNMLYTLTEESMKLSRAVVSEPIFTGSPLKKAWVPETPVLYIFSLDLCFIEAEIDCTHLVQR